MPSYEITEVESEFNTWTAKKGPAAGQEFRSYKVTAKGPDGELHDFEINRKPNSGPPPLGAVEAEVQPSNGNFPDKLKLTPQGRSGGSSGAKDDYWQKKEQRDVEGNRRMGRAHAQEMAIRMAALSDEAGETTLDSLCKLIDWFEADVDGSGGTPSTGNRSEPSSAVERSTPTESTAPVSTGFASDKQKAFFERLLKDAGLTSNQVAEVCRYVREALATDRVSKAIDAIKEGDRDKAIEALLQQSIAWHKKQSDVPFDDGGLPPLRENAA